LSMSKETFTDFCIMLGCDYNTNIPKIGPEKSYALMKLYKNIDDIKEIESQKDILHHIRIRELFSIPDEIDFYVPYCGIPNFEKVNEFLFKYGLRFNMNKLKKNLGESELSFLE